MQIRGIIISITIAAAAIVLSGCETTTQPVYQGVEDVGAGVDEAVNEYLPGLGPNPTTGADPYTG